MSSWAPIPQKVIEKQPIYEQIVACPNCSSTNTFPIMNMIWSPRLCNICKHQGFKPRIIGYKDVLVEKYLS